MTASSFSVEAMVRGHHVHKDILPNYGLVHFFEVFIFTVAGQPAKSRKFAPSENFPLYGNTSVQGVATVESKIMLSL